MKEEWKQDRKEMKEKMKEKKEEYKREKEALKNKTEEYDWGKEERKRENMTKEEQENYPEPVGPGWGRPSKGKYSSNMGGYRAFGTLGQGNSSVGLREKL